MPNLKQSLEPVRNAFDCLRIAPLHTCLPGSRRTLAWYPPNSASSTTGNIDTNITLTVTNVGADFTKMGSFGDVTAFGTALVNSMDRSYLLRYPESARGTDPIQVAEAVVVCFSARST